jgi:hypothetical protein
MFFGSNNEKDLFNNFEKIGLKNDIKNNNILIKIKSARAYKKNHPCTDMYLLKNLVTFIYQNGGTCAITEGSNGYLTENLITFGFKDMLNYYDIKVIDVDLVDCDEVLVNGETHYIPKCFQEYSVRIGFPATSKREEMLYSNNVKLFFGAVPRKKYQLENLNISKGVPRPKLHINLHSSVVNVFLAINNYSPFKYYLNGGLSYNEKTGEFTLPETYIGNNALELDNYLFQTYFNDCEYPEYLNILKAKNYCV